MIRFDCISLLCNYVQERPWSWSRLTDTKCGKEVPSVIEMFFQEKKCYWPAERRMEVKIFHCSGP